MIELDLRVSFEFPLLLTRNLQIWTWPNIFFLAALSAGVKHVEGGGLIEHPSDFEMPDFIVGEEVGLQHVGIFKKDMSRTYQRRSLSMSEGLFLSMLEVHHSQKQLKYR